MYMDSSNKIINRLKSMLVGQQTYDDLIRRANSPDGFMRENAVRRLGMLGNPAALPYLMERANDWVPQVRAAAYDAILNLRKADNAASFIAVLPGLLHLESCCRADHRGLIAKIQEYLSNEENREILCQHMFVSDPHVAKIVCKIVIQGRLLEPLEIVNRCLSHPDVIVRSMAANSLQLLDTKSFNDVITQALSDGFMPVRREAFQQLLHKDLTHGLSVARRFLFDQHISIREIAIANLMRSGCDVLGIYDVAFTKAKRAKEFVCVLWGWTALGCRARAEEVKPFLTNSSPMLRRSALQSLAKLIVKNAEPYLLVGLKDEARSVCIESSRLLIKLSITLTAEQLIATVGATKAQHTLVACCNLASMGNKWSWLQVVLELYKLELDEEGHKFLGLQIRDWNYAFNRSAAQPTSQQITALVTSARLLANQIDRVQWSLLQFTLKNYGGKL